jgi:hypothetical protein
MNLAFFIEDNNPKYKDPIIKAFTEINLRTSKNAMILGYIIEVLYRALKYYKIWDEISPLIKSPLKNKLKKVIDTLSVIPSNITNNPTSNIDNEFREIFMNKEKRAILEESIKTGCIRIPAHSNIVTANDLLIDQRVYRRSLKQLLHEYPIVL